MKTGLLKASLVLLDENDWVVIDPFGRFDASPNAEKLMHYVLSSKERGYEVIAFAQLSYATTNPACCKRYSRASPCDVGAFRDVRLWPDVQELHSSSQNPGNTKRTIKLTNRGGGIGRVQVFVNDREFIEDARDHQLKQNPEVKESLITFDLKGASIIAGEQPKVKSDRLEL